jgi:hypothetical protein
VLATLGMAACGQADRPTGPVGTDSSLETAAAIADDLAPAPGAADALCRPAPEGMLRARIQGAIDAEIDWSVPDEAQCLGGERPGDAGHRLVYKGMADGQPLLIVIGLRGPLGAGTTRHVPANVTVVREGSGVFYATQGDDKCAFDVVELGQMAPGDPRQRLTGRGYCTQPARAVDAADGAVLLSRFDVDSVLEPAEK